MNKNPGIVNITDPDSGDEYHSVFNGDDLSYLTTQLLYSSEAIPLLPKMIYDARKGEFKIPRKILPVLVFDRTFADGMYMTVMCAEDYDFETKELDGSGAYPSVLEEQQIGNELVLDICRDFGVPELGPEADLVGREQHPNPVIIGLLRPGHTPRLCRTGRRRPGARLQLHIPGLRPRRTPDWRLLRPDYQGFPE